MNAAHDAMDETGVWAEGRPRLPAEACTELGAEPRKERMGRVSTWERWALTLGPGLLGSFAAVVIVTAAIWSRNV